MCFRAIDDIRKNEALDQETRDKYDDVVSLLLGAPNRQELRMVLGDDVVDDLERDNRDFLDAIIKEPQELVVLDPQIARRTREYA